MSESVACLSNMPWHITDKIIDYTDAISRVSLRRCSKSLLEYVDRSSPVYESIFLQLCRDDILLTIKADSSREMSVEYGKALSGCVVKTENRTMEVEGTRFMAQAFNDLTSIFKNPNAFVKMLEIRQDDPPYQIKDLFRNHRDERSFHMNLEKTFNAANKKVAVADLRLNIRMTEVQMMNVIHGMQPGTLANITLATVERQQTIPQVVCSKQWEHAKNVTIDRRGCEGLDQCYTIPVVYFLHLRRASFRIVEFTPEIIRMILDSCIARIDSFEFFEIWDQHYIGDEGTYARITQILRELKPEGYHNEWGKRIRFRNHPAGLNVKIHHDRHFKNMKLTIQKVLARPQTN